MLPLVLENDCQIICTPFQNWTLPLIKIDCFEWMIGFFVTRTLFPKLSQLNKYKLFKF